MTSLKTELANIKAELAQRSIANEARLKKAYTALRMKIQGLSFVVLMLSISFTVIGTKNLILERNNIDITYLILLWIVNALFFYTAVLRIGIRLVKGKEAKELEDFVQAYLKVVADEAVCAVVLNSAEQSRYKAN